MRLCSANRSAFFCVLFAAHTPVVRAVSVSLSCASGVQHVGIVTLRASHTLLTAGADETKLTREALKWPYGEFEIPDEVYETFSAAEKKGKKAEEEWNKVQSPRSKCAGSVAR